MVNAEKVFNALGDPTRRAIFGKIRLRSLSVAEIAKGMTVSRPAVSQHLKVLREARLITMRQQGTKSLCQVDQQGLLLMRNYLDNFWTTALSEFKVIAEKKIKDHERRKD